MTIDLNAIEKRKDAKWQLVEGCAYIAALCRHGRQSGVCHSCDVEDLITRVRELEAQALLDNGCGCKWFFDNKDNDHLVECETHSKYRSTMEAKLAKSVCGTCHGYGKKMLADGVPDGLTDDKCPTCGGRGRL